MNKKADFEFINCGNICVLTAQTRPGREWMAEHLPDDATQWAGGIVIEHRYVDDIISGIKEGGLSVR